MAISVCSKTTQTAVSATRAHFQFSFVPAECPEDGSVRSSLLFPRNLLYRPISITSFLARTFGKIVKQTYLRYLEVNKIIPDNQFRISPGRSVETSILAFLNNWTEGMESKSRVDVVYFGFSKAFKPMPQLFFQVSMVGIHPTVINWTRSFLNYISD